MSGSREVKGISFPFRIGVKGGVVMSVTNTQELTHFQESIVQVLNTKRFERTMEKYVFTNLDADIFSPNDLTTRTLIEKEILQSLNLIDGISVTSIKVYGEDNTVYADIHYGVPSLGITDSTQVKVGEY